MFKLLYSNTHTVNLKLCSIKIDVKYVLITWGIPQHPLIILLTYSLTHWLTQSLAHSLAGSFNSLTYLLTTHLLIHSPHSFFFFTRTLTHKVQDTLPIYMIMQEHDIHMHGLVHVNNYHIGVKISNSLPNLNPLKYSY